MNIFFCMFHCLFVRTDVSRNSRDAPSPQVGWGHYKEEHPDQFRTPVKEENFNWGGPMDHDDDYRGGRGGGRDRGGRFGRRRHDGWEGRGGRGNRGNWNNDRWNNGRGNNGPVQPFLGGLGGGRSMANNFPFPDINTTSPEVIRKEVIPNVMRMVEEGRNNGSINENQFREFMAQVAMLNETSLIKEQEMRMRAQENKENHRHNDRGAWRPEQGSNSRPILLGPPPPMINGDLEMPGLARPNDASQGRSPHKNDLPMADQNLLDLIDADPTKSLPIDDQPRMIRFYGETATIVMTDHEVCELTFQPDPEDRQVLIDRTVAVVTRVNEGYKEFELDGEKHQLKIGPPTRELWIDGKWYECYFNNSAGVQISGRMRDVFLDGPPPNVKIGETRPDLCLGRIYALLDGNLVDRMPVFLDNKPQRIDIAGKPHVIQFVEGFKTLTINGHPFRSDFGGFPMVISVNGKKHYLRLSQLPSGVNLDNLPRHRNNSAPRASSPGQQARGPSPSGAKRSTSPPSTADMAPNSPGDETSQDGLRKNDPLGSLISLFPSANDNVPSTPGSSYKSNTADSSPAPALSSSEALGAAVTSKVEPVNVNNLFESLNKFDWSMFGIGSSSSSGGGIPGLSDITPAPLVQPPPDLVPPAPVTKTPKLKLPSAPIKEIVLQSHHQTLKERQESIIEQLYRADDLQCKSCGVRFSKEEMPQYTSHLDWHFR